MTVPPRTTNTNTTTPAGLDWHLAAHYDHRGDRPCVLCGRPTPLRSHRREPAHKVCAEAWNAEHPNETRFVPGPNPRARRSR